ncbi:MAG: YqaJ viral recombinase family protein [Oscillospiraceae bacterium]|nr:YqaJ viral recombinase family protein [Oscillospiraceae bacterium]
MSVILTTYNSREEWLEHRQGIGASEAGAVCGYGFKTPVQLWREKLQIDAPADISDNPRVAFGNAVEEPMRALFRVMHPEYQLDFIPYTVLRREDHHQFMFYTPDGWLTEAETGRKGLWECKSATCLSANDWSKWKDQVPPGYFCQVLHGMYVGDFQFAILFAILLNKDGDAEIRAYHFERSDYAEDIEWLIREETTFWSYVQRGEMPPQRLIL